MRVDAGFVAGDEVSSHYDPMIAKLIVRGPNRTTAIQKLHLALENYEIAGVITNIDFIKRICEHETFVAGDVETGFIKRFEDDLFRDSPTPCEISAQTALAILAREAGSKAGLYPPVNAGNVGFTGSLQNRQFHFRTGSQVGGQETRETVVKVLLVGAQTYTVLIGDQVYQNVQSTWDSATSTLTSFFPHGRFDTRLIFEDTKIMAFSRGSQHTVQIAPPNWMKKALGVKDLTHSVLTPMPCKVLRVEVSAGDSVKKDQALVVIESMKMETVIRSPQDGVIARVVHEEGVRTSLLNIDLCSQMLRTFAKLEQHWLNSKNDTNRCSDL